jgi:hypothetical protein
MSKRRTTYSPGFWRQTVELVRSGRNPEEAVRCPAERDRALRQRSRGSYGVPRILGDLQEEGERVNHKRVAPLAPA